MDVYEFDKMKETIVNSFNIFTQNKIKEVDTYTIQVYDEINDNYYSDNFMKSIPVEIKKLEFNTEDIENNIDIGMVDGYKGYEIDIHECNNDLYNDIILIVGGKSCTINDMRFR